MDYKEKYEEALENFKKIKAANKDNKELVDFIEYKYPELKESEEESIKEDIISLVNEFWERIGSINPEYSSRSKMIAWLENHGDKPHEEKVDEEMREIEEKAKAFSDKHKGESSDDFLAQMRGEQKPTDKVEPKFKVGDYIINEHGFIMQIDGIDGNMYIYHVLDNTGERLTYDINKTEKSCHLWTIQDAKDGDVLAFSYASRNYIQIYKRLYGKCFKTIISVYCFYCVEEDTYYDETDSFHVMNRGEIITPATKEQRDLLFAKMKEAGHEWDAEKKELKNIEQKSSCMLAYPSCSDEDEKIRKALINVFSTHQDYEVFYGVSVEDIRAWLENPDKQNPKMIQWTGANLKEVIEFTGKSPKFNEWFKSWEEFEAYVHSHNDIFKLFDENGNHYEIPVGAWIVKTPDGYNVASRATYIEKLSKRYTWKPSEEQMEVLVWCKPLFADPKSKGILESLIEDLKKLREE